MMPSIAVLTLTLQIGITIIIDQYVIVAKPLDNNELNAVSVGDTKSDQQSARAMATNIDKPLTRQGLLYSDPTLFSEPNKDAVNSPLKLNEAMIQQSVQFSQEASQSSAPAPTQSFGAIMVSSFRTGIERLYYLVNPFQYFIPVATRNLQESIKTLTVITGELFPTIMQLSRESRNLSALANDFPATYSKLYSVVTKDLPQISTSLPNSLMQLANAVSSLRSTAKQVPLELRKSSADAVMNLASQVRNLRETVGTFQALVTDTLPKTVLLAAGTTQSSVMNVTRITSTINNLANAAKELPDSVQRLQAAVASVSNTIQRLPPGVRLSEEVIQELAETMMRLPDIVKAVPANIKSLTNVLQNLKNTIKRAPSDIKGTVGLLPAVGDRDPNEAMNRIRLKEYFAAENQQQIASPNITLGKSMIASYQRNSSDKTGIDNSVRNIAGSLREAIAMVQGQSGVNSDVLSPVKPLVQSFQSLLDVIERMPIADKFFPRATFEPILNLVKTLTASVAQT